MSKLQPVAEAPSGKVFTETGSKMSPKEVALADKIAQQGGREIVMAKNPNEAGIDAFDKATGEPIQLKSLQASPPNQPNKVVTRANEAYENARNAGWKSVELHIEAKDASKADVVARWQATNRIPTLKPMPDGVISKIRVYCADGSVP
jgi:hypothetical protein